MCFRNPVNLNSVQSYEKKWLMFSESGKIYSNFVPMFFRGIVIAVIAALVIAFSSPLFAVLGFEYSTIMALALSFVCGIASAKNKVTNGTNATLFRIIVLECVTISSVPLVISVISLVWLPNCSFWDGLVFYLEIAYPSAILGGLFGLAFSWLVKKPSKAIVLFIVFWIVTLALSFLPGYFNPQLFTYGWQYGFFPGIVWDESLELTNAYFFSRCDQLLLVSLFISLGFLSQKTNRTDRTHWLLPIFFLALWIVLLTLNDKLGITTSHDAVRSKLTKVLHPVPNCSIYYADSSLTQDELDKIERDVRWYLHNIRDRFSLTDTTKTINIYIYPSSDVMFSLIGTRTASISKPWLGELHIAKENLESLKHEFTHVLLREKGVFPFYVSWSTGLTEGAAMSVEPEYDGIYTLDEHAARILQMHYATGVKEVMSFSGFASNASQKSYVLAGSFSLYLLKTYGPLPFNRVYASLDWKKEYGKPLDSLEAEWKHWLVPMMSPMDAGDSEHFRYYYDRASIIYNPCLRRIGKLEREASVAFRSHHYSDAAMLYGNAIKEGAGISAPFGVENVLIWSGNWRGALAMLDTTNTPILKKQKSAFDLQRADLHALARDTAIADNLYTHAQALKLGWQRFLLSYASQVLMHSYPESLWQNYLTNVFTNNKWNSNASDSLLKTMQLQYAHPSNGTFDQTAFAINILRSDNLIRKGKFMEATNVLTTVDSMHSGAYTENDSLAVLIYFRERGKLVSSYSGEEYCPIKYRRAAREITDEINAEWKYLQQNPAARGRETYP